MIRYWIKGSALECDGQFNSHSHGYMNRMWPTLLHMNSICPSNSWIESDCY